MTTLRPDDAPPRAPHLLLHLAVRLALAVALIGATGVALMPAEQMPSAFQFWDKAQHALAYFGLGLAGFWAFSHRPNWVLGGLIVHGALVEVLQATLTTTRQGEWSDWLADGVGVALAWAVARAAGWLTQRGRSEGVEPATER
jgi:VanZ family protein